MKGPMGWYKCWPRKLLDCCESLGSAALVATYRTVIDRIYECEGPIANDPASIGRYAGLRPSHASKAISELIKLRKLFEAADGKLFNEFAEAELSDRSKLSEKRAEAGSKGGRSRAQREANGDQGEANGDQGGNNPRREAEKSPENGHSRQANASTRAGEKRREEREDSPPAPQGGDPNGQKPVPLSEFERARLAKQVAAIADRPDGGAGDIAHLTGEIMRRANMVAPPLDLVLAGTWVALGVDVDLILETVTRMAGAAKSQIRAFRYFDAEIRRQHAAQSAGEQAQIQEFNRITARARSE